jgi:hypothetical protein
MSNASPASASALAHESACCSEPAQSLASNVTVDGAAAAAKAAGSAPARKRQVFMGERKDARPLPSRFTKPELYAAPPPRSAHPFYRSTASAYGSVTPSKHEMQEVYFPIPNTIARTHGPNYRNFGLNTSLGKPQQNIDMGLF